MRICIDLDGTICSVKKDGESYKDMIPLPDAVESLQNLKRKGHYIIIHTARNMVTYSNNIGQIIANQAPVVIEWLKRWNIPYDELLFGKPPAELYIDDRGIKFDSWKNINKLIP